ncbi:hypothetical protein ACFVHB_13115 [Kitasatospora sp. NPDC127111]|uniref:hypothetical protein n=1 Tax=Kitasatospora sp. NPDC127111 TaxID=3345363 RepID=UPI00362BA652
MPDAMDHTKPVQRQTAAVAAEPAQLKVDSPPVGFCDEPTGALDEEMGRHVLGAGRTSDGEPLYTGEDA